MPRWAAKKDTTHGPVIDALIACGWYVMDVSRAPLVIDLIIAKAGRVVIVEVKSRSGRITKRQADIFAEWPGETAILRSVKDVLALNRSGQVSDKQTGAI
jgi:hypothetical protein